MDTEQQVRINFLDEAQTYFDRMEEVFLNAAAIASDPQQLDAALRAAHSVKGGAAMMGFDPLSKTAHRLEDFLKILRVRTVPVDTELETLFLQCVDALRAAGDLHRQSEPTVAAEIDGRTAPLFARLQERLGDLQPEDDDAILAQEEDVDVASLMFESGVADCLERLEPQVGSLAPDELRAELLAAADELAEFGRMKSLDRFVALCASVGQYARSAPPDGLEALAREAIAVWQRSQGLVVLGRLEKLPDCLETDIVPAAAEPVVAADPPELQLPDFDDIAAIDFALAEFADLQPAPAAISEIEPLDADVASLPPLDDLDIEELADLRADISGKLQIDALDPDDLPDDIAAIEDERLAEPAAAEGFPDIAEPLADDDPAAEGFPDIAEPLTDGDLDAIAVADAALALLEPEALAVSEGDRAPAASLDLVVAPSAAPSERSDAGAMVRVPAEQLHRVNRLFGQLILERNAIGLRLDQLQEFVDLMQARMQRLEQSNLQLRKWYDRASVEGLLGPNGPALGSAAAPKDDRGGLFDTLEMDRYSELHPIAQEQMETIVQLQEVAVDIRSGVREMGQATGNLERTTRELQRSITRTQMRPFGDIVGRFRRVVRDLSLQYGKQVDLQLGGETVLLDRLALEALTDPLNHLLRNAFDHGIEAPADRQAAGKSPRGTIAIEATNRGNQTVITIRDDGGGIPLDKIRARVVRMGLTPQEVERLDERDLLEFIFEPGFSTTDRVTELSGRGVGMDVVRTNLRQLRGDITVSTQAGRGTTFAITIPQSLSILRVMLLETAGLVFAVAADAVREVTCPDADCADVLVWNDERVPVLQLAPWLQYRRPYRRFEMEGTPQIERETVAVVGRAGAWRGLAIDRFWGEREATIRAIDSPVALMPGMVGATVLGDGRAIPLIDLPRLLAWIDERDREETEASLPAAESLRPTAESQSAAEALVLVVDDSVNVRRYLSIALERAGYQVEQAKDGREATDKIFNNRDIAAVICDVEMPHMDGYDVLAEVRAQEEFRQLPIAMLTSRSSEKHRKLAMNLGASAYFSKPYNEQEMLQALAEMLQGRAPAVPSAAPVPI